MTILELLVVLLILLMVTAAAIPIVAPAMQNRQMREAARLVSSYLSSARGRAIDTGRPAGVMVERFNGEPFGLVLSEVEVPPPYGGDFEGSRMIVTPSGQIRFIGTISDPSMLPGGSNASDAAWRGLIRYGDLVKLDYKGPTYILSSVAAPTADPLLGQAVTGGPNFMPAMTTWHLRTAAHTTPLLPPSYDAPPTAPGTGVAFQIIRQPTRSLTAPLQLPEGIVVDLTCSGMGSLGTFMSPASFAGGMTGSVPAAGPEVPFDPVILFSPSGRLEAVSQGPTGTLVRPSDAMYLLLGRRELMFDATRKNQTSDVVNQNLSAIPADPMTSPAPPPHFWVSVGYQTGLVTVAEVARNLQDHFTAGQPLTDVIINALPDARQFARQSQSVGGN